MTTRNILEIKIAHDTQLVSKALNLTALSDSDEELFSDSDSPSSCTSKFSHQFTRDTDLPRIFVNDLPAHSPPIQRDFPNAEFPQTRISSISHTVIGHSPGYSSPEIEDAVPEDHCDLGMKMRNLHQKSRPNGRNVFQRKDKRMFSHYEVIQEDEQEYSDQQSERVHANSLEQHAQRLEMCAGDQNALRQETLELKPRGSKEGGHQDRTAENSAQNNPNIDCVIAGLQATINRFQQKIQSRAESSGRHRTHLETDAELDVYLRDSKARRTIGLSPNEPVNQIVQKQLEILYIHLCFCLMPFGVRIWTNIKLDIQGVAKNFIWWEYVLRFQGCSRIIG